MKQGEVGAKGSKKIWITFNSTADSFLLAFITQSDDRLVLWGRGER